MNFLGMIEGYAMPVAIFTPAYFAKPNSQLKILIHLHGHLHSRNHLGGRVEKFEDVLDEFQFDSLLDKTGRNDTVLIVPSSIGKCDTYKDSFNTKKGYEIFLKNTVKKIIELGLTNDQLSKFALHISGHSGAYNPIETALSHPCERQELCSKGNLRSVTLLDATYGKFSEYAKLISQYPQVKFNIAYLDQSTTSQGAHALWNRLSNAGIVAGGLSQSEIRLTDDIPLTEKQRLKLQSTNPSFISWSSIDRDAHWKLARELFWLGSN